MQGCIVKSVIPDAALADAVSRILECQDAASFRFANLESVDDLTATDDADAYIYAAGGADVDRVVRDLQKLGGSAPVIVIMPDISQQGKLSKAGAAIVLSGDEAELSMLPRLLLSLVRLGSARSVLEDELKNTALLLSMLMSELKIGCSVEDEKGRLMLVNQALADECGLSVMDLTGRTLGSLCVSGMAQQALAEYRTSVKAGRDFAGDLVLRKGDDRAQNFQVHSMQVHLGGSRKRRLNLYYPRGQVFLLKGTEAPSSLRAWLARLASKIKGRMVKQIVRGNYQMVGLHRVREKLGPGWGAVSARAVQLAEAVICAYLDDDDFYQPEDNGDFTVCFAHLEPAEARVRAAEIAEAVSDAILIEFCRPEEDEAGKMTAKELAEARALAEMADAMAEVSVQTDEIAVMPDDALIPDDRGPTIRQQAALEPASDEKAAVIRRDLPVMLRQVMKATREPASLMLLDPVGGAGNLPQMSGRNMSQLDHGDLLFAEDLRVLKSAAVYMAEHKTRGFVSVSLHFNTLMNDTAWQRYVAELKKLDESLLNKVMFRLCGFPFYLDRREIVGYLDRLALQNRPAMIVLEDISLVKVPIEHRMVFNVTIPYESVARQLNKDKVVVENLIVRAHENNTKVLIDNVPEDKMAGLLSSIDVDLLTGTVSDG